MSAITICARCKESFRHSSVASATGYYAVNCPNGHELLRCTSCIHNVDRLRTDHMIRHIQSRHAINDEEVDAAATDLIFDDVQQGGDDINNNNADDIRDNSESTV